MAGVANSNAALLRRIVQLEKEKEELQTDIETMCLQQAGVSGSIDVTTRMQARRAAGLEQELETSKEKVALLMRENHNINEELSEAFRLKPEKLSEDEIMDQAIRNESRLTEAFKAAVEKSSQVEKEVKFYQSKVAAALAERDKAVVEVERVHESEKVMTSKVKELYIRMDDVEGRSQEHETQQKELQEELDTSRAQLTQLYRVVEKFWHLRGSSHGSSEEDQELSALQPLGKATALLGEADSLWCYGGTNQQAEYALRQELNDARELAEQERLQAKMHRLQAGELVSQLAELKIEYEGNMRTLQAQLTEEQCDRGQAEGNASMSEAHLEHFKLLTTSKLQQLHNKQCELKLDVTGVLEDEKRWLETMVIKLHALKDNAIGRGFHSEPVDKYEEERGPPPDEETSTADPLIAEEALPTELVGETEESDSRSVATIVPSSEESDTTMLTPPEVSIQVSTISEVVSETKDEAYPVSEADSNDIIITREEHFSAVVNLGKNSVDMDDDSRKALAQALHEKVEALLLLSQQEERYHLESKTIQGLECQIKDLKEKIAQVTREKISALMEVAQLRQDCQRHEERERQLIRMLQQHRSTSASGRLLPSNWSEASVPPVLYEPTSLISDKQGGVPRAASLTTGSYLKSWLSRLDVSGPGFKASSDSNKHVVVTDSSKSSQTDESIDFAKLRVENVALQERVASVQRLTESAHHLRMTLVKASYDSQNEAAASSLQAALEIVKGVNVDAGRLKIALGCSLPVSWSGPEIVLEPNQSTGLVGDEANISRVEGDARAAIDTASAAGIEMVELLLATSELQKQALQCRLDMLAK